MAVPTAIAAMDAWPVSIVTAKGKLIVYEPQAEYLNGNKLSFKAAFSIQIDTQSNFIFGGLTATTRILTNRGKRLIVFDSLTKVEIRIVDSLNTDTLKALESFLSKEISKQKFFISMDRIIVSLKRFPGNYSAKYNHSISKILYAQQPSLLAMTESQYDSILKTAAKSEEGWTSPQIIVSTAPAALIQTVGEARFRSIPNTDLEYATNTADPIFRDKRSEKYFTLISGRWFTSSYLEKSWKYLSAANLPPDFKNIPYGIECDYVLANIPGTRANKEAIADAQMPQTAIVDKKLSTQISFDGEPVFKAISGTQLEYALNTPYPVFRSNKQHYYAVDGGIWFTALSANGPWKVAVSAPTEIEKIPADIPVYNAKFVYVYEHTNEKVYVGYTSGYLNAYVDNGMPIFGTGYTYTAWSQKKEVPHLQTWEFAMHYVPWQGWSSGVGLNIDRFDLEFGIFTGWKTYTLPFFYPYTNFYGDLLPYPVSPHYGLAPNLKEINKNKETNIYEKRPYVSKAPEPERRRNTGAIGSGQQNVYVDSIGDIYQFISRGQWQQRKKNKWKAVRETEFLKEKITNTQQGNYRSRNVEQVERTLNERYVKPRS